MCQNRPQRNYKTHFVCPKCGYSKKSNKIISMPILEESKKATCERCLTKMEAVSYDVEMPRMGSRKHNQMLKMLKNKKAKLCGTHGCGCQSNRGNVKPKKWTATSEKLSIVTPKPIPTKQKWEIKKIFEQFRLGNGSK